METIIKAWRRWQVNCIIKKACKDNKGLLTREYIRVLESCPDRQDMYGEWLKYAEAQLAYINLLSDTMEDKSEFINEQIAKDCGIVGEN